MADESPEAKVVVPMEVSGDDRVAGAFEHLIQLADKLGDKNRTVWGSLVTTLASFEKPAGQAGQAFDRMAQSLLRFQGVADNLKDFQKLLQTAGSFSPEIQLRSSDIKGLNTFIRTLAGDISGAINSAVRTSLSELERQRFEASGVFANLNTQGGGKVVTDYDLLSLKNRELTAQINARKAAEQGNEEELQKQVRLLALIAEQTALVTEREKQKAAAAKEASAAQAQVAKDEADAARSREQSAAVTMQSYLDNERVRQRAAEQAEQAERERIRRLDQSAAVTMQGYVDRYNEQNRQQRPSRNSLSSQFQYFADWAVIGSGVGAVYGAVNDLMAFEKAMNQLMMTTGASAATMKDLRDTITGVASASIFSTQDITQAAAALVRFGFTADQLRGGLAAVTNYAAASGTTPDDAAKIITQSVAAFNLQSSEAGSVSDVFTNTLRKSRVDPTVLNRGIQNTSAVAAQSGLNITDLSASFGVLANSGARMSERFGDAFRTLLTDLSEPSEKLKEVLTQTGLSVDAVDVKTQGWTKVLTTLRDAGLTGADAVRAFGTESGNLLTILASHVDELDAFKQGLTISGSAATATKVGLSDLGNSFQQLRNVFASTAETAFKPVIEAMTGVVHGLTAIVETAGNLGPITALVGTFTALTAAFQGLSWLQRGVASFGALAAEGGVVASVFARLNPIVLAVTTALSLGAAAWEAYREKFPSIEEREDRLAGRMQNTQAALDDRRRTISELNSEIDRLSSQGSGNVSQTIDELNTKFANLGASISHSTTSTQGLIEALAQLRQGAQSQNVTDLNSLLADQEAKASLAEQSYVDKFGNGFLPRNTRSRQVGRVFIPGSSRPSAGSPELDALLDQANDLVGGLRPSGDRSSQIDAVTSMSARLSQAVRDNPQNKTLLEDVQKFKDAVSLFTTGAEAFRAIADRRDALSVGQAAADPNSLYQRLLNASSAASAVNRQYSDQLATTTNVDQRATLQNERLKALKALLDPLEAEFKEADPAAQKAAREALTQLQSRITDAATAAATSIDEQRKYQLKVVNGDASLASAQFQGVQAQLREPEIRLADIDPLEQKGVADLERRTQDRLKALQLQQSAAKGDAILAPNELEAQQLLIRQEGKTAIETFKQTVQALREKFIDTTDHYSEWAKSVKDELTSADAEAKRASDAAKLPVERAGYLRQAAQSAASRGLISSVQANEAADPEATRTLQQQALKGQIDAVAAQYDRYVSVIQEMVLKESRLLEERETLAERESNGPLSADDKQRKDQLDKDINDVQLRINDATDKQLKLLGDEAKLREQMLAYKDPQSVDFSTGAALAVKQYDRANKVNQSVSDFGLDALASGMNSSTAALSKFFTNTVTGTKSVKAAFKDMVQSILQSMLQLLANKEASMLLSAGMNALFGAAGEGGAMPGEAGSTGSLSADDATFMFSAGGGPVNFRRAASGAFVTGDVSTRDSVPYMLEPGEFVMRQSAVSMLGADTLASLNAMGNSKISAAKPMAPSLGGKPHETNVYVVNKDEVPPGLQPNDVMAIWSKDVMTGGAGKKLIKKVMNGEV